MWPKIKKWNEVNTNNRLAHQSEEWMKKWRLNGEWMGLCVRHSVSDLVYECSGLMRSPCGFNTIREMYRNSMMILMMMITQSDELYFYMPSAQLRETLIIITNLNAIFGAVCLCFGITSSSPYHGMFWITGTIKYCLVNTIRRAIGVCEVTIAGRDSTTTTTTSAKPQMTQCEQCSLNYYVFMDVAYILFFSHQLWFFDIDDSVCQVKKNGVPQYINNTKYALVQNKRNEKIVSEPLQRIMTISAF